MAIVMALCLPLSGQNFFLNVIEEESLQPVYEARVTVYSDDVRIARTTDARGNVFLSLDPGSYTVTVEKIGFLTQREDIVIIRESSIILELRLVRGVSDEDRGRRILHQRPVYDSRYGDLPEEETAVAADQKIPFTKTNRTLFIDAGYQYGNISAINLGAGIVYNNIVLSLGYARSNQSYESYLFRNLNDYDLLFNQVSAGIGYEYKVNTGLGNLDLFITPMVVGGAEFVDTRRLLSDNSINYLMNFFVQPRLMVGINFQRFDVFAGTNYSAWLTQGMTDQRYGMVNGETGDDVRWSDDLFNGRKGIAVVAGLRIHLINF